MTDLTLEMQGSDVERGERPLVWAVEVTLVIKWIAEAQNSVNPFLLW